MAHLIRIGERILNLDQLIFAQRDLVEGEEMDENGAKKLIPNIPVVHLVFKEFRTDELEQRRGRELNAIFVKDNADFVWDKLEKMLARGRYSVNVLLGSWRSFLHACSGVQNYRVCNLGPLPSVTIWKCPFAIVTHFVIA